MVDIYHTNKKYKLIYADPPWYYRAWSNKKNKKCAEAHYNTMTVEELKNIPVKKISEKDSVLLLWVTFPCLEDGLKLIADWGFQYKTVAFVWVKTNKVAKTLHWGLGSYTRANVELCLLATKGKPLPRKSRSVHQVVFSLVREHSRKPDEVREKIVELFGNIPKIELFARQTFEGWNAWGNEVNLFNKQN